MFNDDLEKLSSLLDGTIQKGLKSKKTKIERYEENIVKGLTFDPMNPTVVGGDAPYYNPYRFVSGENGGFLPYRPEHWEAFGKDKENYLVTRDFYDRYIETKKSLDGLKALKSTLDHDLVKAGAVPVGTVHVYADGQRYKKIAEGKWTPVAGNTTKRMDKFLNHPNKQWQDKAHQAIESHAAKVTKLQSEIKDRQKQQKQSDDIRSKTTKDVVGHMRSTLGKLYEGGKLPKEMDDHLTNVERSSGIGDQLKNKIKKLGKGQGREVKLSSEEVQTLLQSGKFALVSAGRNPANEQDRNLSDDQVSQRHNQLHKDLRQEGHAFTRLGGDELAVMIHDADREQIKKLGKKYNQDSVIYSEGGKHEMHFTTGDNKGLHHKGEGLDPNAETADDYYSEIKTSDGKNIKFSLNFDFTKHHGGDKPKPVDADKKLEEASKEVMGKKHHVTVHFRHGTKDYSHKFENVVARTHGDATDKVHSALRQKLPGSQVTRIHTETVKEAQV